MAHAYRNCADCIGYSKIRYSVLAAAITARSDETGEAVEQILDRFMSGVHARHLTGLPILPERAA